MKIISHHPAHKDEVNKFGMATINGLLFTRGDEGLPTCVTATAQDCNAFADVDGFAFYHNDGALAGESKTKDYLPPIDVITAALNEGTISLAELRAMDLQIPGLGSLNGLIDKTQDPMNSRSTPDALSPNEIDAGLASTPYDDDASEQSALNLARAHQAEDARDIRRNAAEVEAQVAADLQVPVEDVKVNGDVIELSGEAARVAADSVNLEAQGADVGAYETQPDGSGSVQVKPGEIYAQDFNQNEGSEAPTEPVSTEPEPTEETADDSDEDAPAEDPHPELDKSALKVKLTDLGVSYGPRDTRATLLKKYMEAIAAQR